MQERWKRGGTRVIEQALSIRGMNKRPNAESPSISYSNPPNFPDGRACACGMRDAPTLPVPIGRLTVLSAQSLIQH
jgi:hypothetical protein